MGEQEERMLRNEWYLDEPDLVDDRRWCARLLDRFNAALAVEDDERRRAGWERPAPITIGENTWLGAGVIVCPGVDIGSNTVIGAGSVVTRSVGDGVLAAGNPARTIRSI